MAITLARFNLFADHVCRAYARAYGTSAGYGIGPSGATDRAQGALYDLDAALAALGDNALVDALYTDLSNWMAGMTAVNVATHKGFLGALESLLRDLALTGVGSLDQFLTYYNYGSGGTNTALMSPWFRDVFYRWKGAYPTAYNLYYECTQGFVFQGTTHTNALRKLLQGTGQTAGDTISTNFAGGLPKLNCTVFNGASDTVTVTGTQYNPADNTRTAGKTWTATVTATGVFTLASGGGTPASANALICAVSGIVAGANITAGSIIFAEAQRPAAPRLAIPA